MTQFNVVVVGDSVAWGQGLAPNQKFDRQMATDIATSTGSDTSQVENRAHSGATINSSATSWLNPSLEAWQEVPNDAPSVLDQLALGSIDTDLVVVIAGLNDVNFRTVLDPIASDDTLDAAVRQVFQSAIATLLLRIRMQFPNAVIAVAGYYPILSQESEVGVFRLSAALLTLSVGPLASLLLSGAVKERVTRRVRRFHCGQLHWLRSAVTTVHADRRLRGPGVMFVHPGFGPQHAVGAPQALLFGPQPPADAQMAIDAALADPVATGLAIDPGDPMEQQRRNACAAVRTGIDLVTCRVAAIGHPNPDGARRYADAIRDVYQHNWSIPVRSALGKLWQPTSSSLRQVLVRHQALTSDGSLRSLLQHRVVDSIAVTITTKDEPFAGTDHPVSLRLGLRREWLLNEAIFDGDLSNDFEQAGTNNYFIDPVDGTLANRLCLAEITECSLLLRFNPASALGGDWKPGTIRLAANGAEILVVDVDRELHVDPMDQLDVWTAPNFPPAPQ